MAKERVEIRRLRELAEAGQWRALLTAAQGYPASIRKRRVIRELERVALLALGDFKAVMHSLLDQFAEQPNDLTVLRRMGETVPSLRGRELALLDRLDTLAGRDGAALSLLARLYFGDTDGALRSYAAFHARYPQDKHLNGRGILKICRRHRLFTGSVAFAAVAIVEGARDDAVFADLLGGLVGEYSNEREHILLDVEAAAELLAARFPDSVEALLAMALTWRARRRPERAYPYFEAYFQQVPNHPMRSPHAFEACYVHAVGRRGQLEAARGWGSVIEVNGRVNKPLPPVDLRKDRPLRIGYVSPDFKRHPVAYFALPVLKAHAPMQFEVYLFSLHDPTWETDVLTREFEALVGPERWFNVRDRTPGDALSIIRDQKIDILVDLAGHSAHSRLDIFMNRAAPVQVSWLGFPGTTGLAEIDYRFSDAIVDPEGEADCFSSESIWRLPNGFHALEMPEEMPEVSPAPVLRNGYITFGSFNNLSKVCGESIALWARVLRSVKGSRLILKHASMSAFGARERIKSLFALHGVEPWQVTISGRTAQRMDHLAHYAKLDIALDTYAYNGTTTTCEALYMGVPVLTLPGATHAARVSASLLHRVGLGGWVAKNADAYVRIAQAAAAQPERLAERRARLRADFKASPLGDAQGLANDIESAYREMWARYVLAQSAGRQATTTSKPNS